MSHPTTAADISTLGMQPLECYEPLIGSAAVARIMRKAKALQSLHIIHISSTFYGGGVTEILTPLTLMMNALGIETGWRMIQGTPGFFACTKKLHNLLQGSTVDLCAAEKDAYETVVFENSIRLHVEDCDAVIVHDPQPLPLISHFPDRDMPWIWQCHVDLSTPNPYAWHYLHRFIEQYDLAIFSLHDYAQQLGVAQRFITPAINPFSPKNRDMSDEEIGSCLAHHHVPTDRPLVVQISRFDRWKDPTGVIEAFRKAREQVDATLVLLGNNAVDDPESGLILERIHSLADERVIVLTVDDPVLVNALQRRADVVLQKSTREGFGLTVTEAMWKGACVIGGNVGGIRVQIKDGENGFLVDTVDQTAARIVRVLRDPVLRRRIGSRARQTVRDNYLMSRLAEDWIDLLVGLTATADAQSGSSERDLDPESQT
jgi:trehalose synthase